MNRNLIASHSTFQLGPRVSAKKIIALAAFVCLLFPLGASAQVVTASLQGVVRDPSGAVIPGATVVVRNTATGVTTNLATGRDGYFLAPALQPGPYTVTIKAKGFKTLVSTTITLEVDQRAQEHYILQVGAATQTVSVKARAPLLKRTTSDVGQVIDAKQIVNLPLNARNVFALAFLAPGIHGSVGFGFNNLNMQVNGGRPGSTTLLLDGIPSSPPLVNPIYGYSVFPPVDATQEFKVQTSNYSAQFGDAGSGFINLIYKSGTNQLHGDVYEFLRNSALDANSFFNNEHGVPLPTFHRSQFGFTLGGPIVIPKVYNGHDKTFFFGDFEGLRRSTPASTLTTVPTAAMRNGDFSGLVNGKGQSVTIYDPATTVSNGSGGYVRSAFAGNMIPTADINPVSANIMNYWPLPNLPGYVNNFTAAGVATYDLNQYDIKVDENVNAKSRFFVRFSRHKLTNSPPYYFPKKIQVAEGRTLVAETGTDIALDYTHTFSPNFLTEFRYGFARMDEEHRPSSLGFDPTQLGFPAYIAQDGAQALFPGISPSGYTGIGIGGPNFRVDTFNEHSFSLNNTWIFNAHTLNFGFQALIPQDNVREVNQGSGNFSFNRTMTQGPDPLSASSTAGDGFASFLLGVGSGGGIYGSPWKNVATTSQGFAAYLQDDWRATRKLTLNIGLRWDVDLPRTERYNRLEYFDPSAANPLGQQVANAPGASNCPSCSNLLGGLVFVGTKGVGRSQFSSEWANFGPRFGFAYQAAKNTVIRGAYGIFYYAGQTIGAAGTVGISGFSAETQYIGSVDGLTPTNYISNPFPSGITPAPGNANGLTTLVGSSVEGPLPNTVVPYSENWNFSIQQMLPGSIMVQASYVGNHGLLLNAGRENFPFNQLTPAALTLGSALLQKVTNPFYGIITTGPLAEPTVPMSYLQAPFPQFNGVGVDYPTGASSIYHSFQLKVQRRLTSGLTFLASFTGDKSIDDFSTLHTGRDATRQNIYNLRADRSVSANDISRVFSFAGVYQLPFGRGRQFGRNWGGFTDAFLGGWQMNGILSLETGFPLALHTSNTSHSGSPTLRPNYDPNGSGCANGAALSGSISSRLNEYFNTNCFSQPAPFTFGNLGRTISNIRVPGNHDIDFSLFKNFKVGERFTVQFRAESFNLINQVVFGQPQQNFNNSNFGRITSQANSPRQMQFALKVLF